eukprot:c4230_g1_i1.p1 GENE.c4230_g1_i1~~c4230_g1_i1.p1  ORF type:complete len:579 (+),score=166.57 c4230_g1_i1:46-1782(+)
MSDKVKATTLKRARQTGILSLANLSLTEIPDTIWTIYDIRFDDLSFRDCKLITRMVITNNALTAIDKRITSLGGLKELVASENKIRELPDELFSMDSIHVLHFQNNELTSIPDSIGNLVGLRSLNLAHNRLTTIPSSLERLSGLTDLDVSHNQLKDICRLPYPNMTQLVLNNNKIEALPEGCFSELAAVKSINLASNRLTAIPAAVGLDRCRQLTEFNCDNNALTEFDGNFSESVIATLFFGSNRFTAIPTCIFEMKQLSNLVLNSNKIENVPADIQKLTKLTMINLQNNDVKQLAPEMATIKTLKKVNVVGNLLKSIPTAKVQAGDATILEHLRKKLEASNLESSSSSGGSGRYTVGSDGKLSVEKKNLESFLASEVVNAANLTDLSLALNPLRNIPELTTLTALKSLNLASTKLSSVTATNLPPSLETLDLSGNLLTSVSLGECSKLRTVHLSFNKGITIGDADLPTPLTGLSLENVGLTQFPTSIFFLENLKTLSLARNQIKELPGDEMVAVWPKMQNLDLSYNDIRQLPPILGTMKLSALNVEGNPLVVPSRAIANKGTQAILDYLVARLGAQQ